MYKEKKKRREVTTDNSVKLKRTKKKTLTWLNIVQISKLIKIRKKKRRLPNSKKKRVQFFFLFLIINA